MNAVAAGAIGLTLGVGLGAFGAHGLSHLGPVKLGWWGTATQYEVMGSFGLIAVGLFERAPVSWRSPAGLLILGMLLFSGSLYAMALGAPRWFGAITPFGGLSLMGAFAWFAIQAVQR
ncbi:MAG TPA: DUF423 domain-containing protein [Polyangiaceae bacterium]|nr:DUF423 domain-containing protein [Polyangiaceae bacterium]